VFNISRGNSKDHPQSQKCSSAPTCKMQTMELVCHDIVASSGAVLAM
jgi:hypothetical protein